MFLDRKYTPEIEHQCKLLRHILKLAHSKDEYKGKCKLEDNYLVIHDIKYATGDLHKLPNDLSGYHASSKSDDETTVYFGELSPFSNFHKSPFQLSRKSYFCSEQFIQEQKCLEFKNNITAEMITLCENAQECKKLGRNTTGYREEKCKKRLLSDVYPV